MSSVAWIVAAAVLAWWAWTWLRPDPVKLADRAVRTGRLDPVLAALHRVRPAGQATEYHRVLRRLWDGYHREEAVHVAKDLARLHREAPVAQYWLRQFLEHEPDIAKEHLDDAFLQVSYDPAVAAKCGSFG